MLSRSFIQKDFLFSEPFNCTQNLKCFNVQKEKIIPNTFPCCSSISNLIILCLKSRFPLVYGQGEHMVPAITRSNNATHQIPVVRVRFTFNIPAARIIQLQVNLCVFPCFITILVDYTILY